MCNYKYELPEVVERYKTSINSGLSTEEAVKRLHENGPNSFEKAKPEALWKKLLHHLSDITTFILLIAAGISFYMAVTTEHGNYVEGIIIISIVIINAILAILQENNAEKSLAALQELNKQTTCVLRDGKIQTIDAESVVVGDVLVLETGDVIPADGRVSEAIHLRLEESALTGESEPIEKYTKILTGEDINIADQKNMIFSGSTVSFGRGSAVVVATGMDTEMGKIAALLNQEKEQLTPLQRRLSQLGKQISLIALAAATIVFVVGYFQGEPLLEMFMTAISLAVAAVPETLMVIVTLALSHGVQKMVKKHAIIRKLPAVETLGTANVICTDKTGTLTQNKMKVRRVWSRGDEVINIEEGMQDETMEVLKMAALCSNATVEYQKQEPIISGNPTESAIVAAVEENFHTKQELDHEYPRIGEVPFDSDRKCMTTIHQLGNKYLSITKGAFDAILPKIRFGDVEQAAIVNERFGRQALRVIAVGVRLFDQRPDEFTVNYLEKDLRLIGLIGIIDPPRPESKGAILRAKKAGIKTVMITGDHIVTASAIAKELGILEHSSEAITGARLNQLTEAELVENVQKYSVYARVTPSDKIRIVKAWQKAGAVVAMTGDGVNDAPALKASDVGCAMGIAGTDVAKGAADIILTDDNFATIVDAVEEGRTVYGNIRKTVNLLLSCNISEILIVLISMLLGWGTPVIAIQLLFVNVIADGLPGFALAKERAESGIMEESPIPKSESIFAEPLGAWIIFNSIIFTIVTLFGFYLGTNVAGISSWVAPSYEVGQTMAFLILAYSSILHVFNCRSSKSIFKVKLSSNKRLFEMAVLATLIVTTIALVPPFQQVFFLVPLSLNHWRIVVFLSIVPLLAVQMIKFHFAEEEE